MRLGVLIGLFPLFGGIVWGVQGIANADESGFVRLSAENLEWVPGASGTATAKIFGDRTKPGEFYIYQVKFPPFTFDHPHYHPEARHITVIKGTWYTGTGEAVDLDKAIPLKVGSYMYHPGKAVHWDGAKDEEVIVEIAGIGPASSTLIKPDGGQFYYSIQK